MDTIKIKTSHTVETEHEIQIPSYYKSNAHAFKIISPDKCVKVYFGWDKEDRWPINDAWHYHDLHSNNQNLEGYLKAIDKK